MRCNTSRDAHLPSLLLGVAGLALVVIAAACAARTEPALPSVLAYPDFPYLTVPGRLVGTPGASRVDVGWRYLQSGDVRNAALEFDVALELGSGLYPARTGQGYVSAARGNHRSAVEAFAAALAADGRYLPALVGHGLSSLALDRNAEALASFEAALDVDPSLVAIGRRVEVLRFRVLQDVIDAARAAVASGQVEEARAAYARALQASPESPFLYRELADVERRAGADERALTLLARVVELDPTDAAALVTTGDLLVARGDTAAAEAAYRRAAAADPGVDLGDRLATAASRAREASLPPEFGAAQTAPRLTRGDLAALVGVRLEDLLAGAPVRQVVMTDVENHWAAAWITRVAGAGAIEAFENHTFQPDATVRRGELATVARRLIDLVAATAPSVGARAVEPPAIADLPRGHLQYEAVSLALAAGVLPLLEGGTFQVGRLVSGEEAVEMIDRVRALADAARGAARP